MQRRMCVLLWWPSGQSVMDALREGVGGGVSTPDEGRSQGIDRARQFSPAQGRKVIFPPGEEGGEFRKERIWTHVGAHNGRRNRAPYSE